jgi:hypothetical protein
MDGAMGVFILGPVFRCLLETEYGNVLVLEDDSMSDTA